jgi:integrase
MTRGIVERLYREAGADGFLIANPRTGKPFGSIKTVWLRLLREAGLEGKPGVDRLRLHDLRHSFASRLAEKKDISVVKELLGHSSIQTTLRYVHRTDRDLAEASETVCEVLPKVLPGGQKQDSTKIVSIGR